MTPASVANFMASLFQQKRLDECRLLDPGFGAGSLSIAFLERWASGKFDFESMELTACEIDPQFHENIPARLQPFSSQPNFIFKIQIGDFIEKAVNWLLISTHSGNTSCKNQPSIIFICSAPETKLSKLTASFRKMLLFMLNVMGNRGMSQSRHQPMIVSTI